MMRYDYCCDTCDYVIEVRQPMSSAGGTHSCMGCGNLMRRIYYPTRVQAYYDSYEYIEQAYRGEIQVPGMTTAEVRATVNSKPRVQTKRRRVATSGGTQTDAR
jgi:predicted nucleic acid-binding Zn ribbon protein